MFQPGDVLLYTAPALKFDNIVPRFIRVITGNKVTHVAVYLGMVNENHLVVEALSDGIKIRTYSETTIADRKDDFKLYGIARLPNLEVDFKNKIFAVSAAKYTHAPYGYLTILNLLLQHSRGWIVPKKPWVVWFKSKKGYVCSEVAQLVIGDVLELNNIPSPFKKPAAVTEPDDYLVSPWEVIKV